jgi:hypothetical protein
MDWLGVTEELALLRREVAEFCAKEVAAQALDHNRRGTPPIELITKSSQLGLCAVAVPEAQGGAGMGALAVTIVLEEVARVFPSLALSLAAQTMVGMVIAESGEDRLQAELGPQVASGREIAAVSLVEDALVGARQREGIALRGELRLVVNGTFAQLFLAEVEVEGAKQWAIAPAPAADVQWCHGTHWVSGPQAWLLWCAMASQWRWGSCSSRTQPGSPFGADPVCLLLRWASARGRSTAPAGTPASASSSASQLRTSTWSVDSWGMPRGVRLRHD